MEFTEIALRSDNNIGVQGHEPDNILVDYYLANDRLENRSVEPFNDVYTNLEWQSENRRITSKAVARFGVKAFPGMGAYGWYHTLHENRNVVVIPINNRKVKYKPPSFTVTKTDRQLVFNIVQPSEEEIQYQCFRITIRGGVAATEYVTYDLLKTVVAPPPGVYEITVFGYLDTDKISEDTPIQNITISAAESWYPDGIAMIPTGTQEAILTALEARIHYQTVASSTWTINHGMGTNPICAITDENGCTMIGTVKYVDLNNIEVAFAISCKGRVYMK